MVEYKNISKKWNSEKNIRSKHDSDENSKVCIELQDIFAIFSLTSKQFRQYSMTETAVSSLTIYLLCITRCYSNLIYAILI